MSERPQQRDLFTRRWRQVRALAASELQIQISLLEHLKYLCQPDVVYYHVPNGELRDKRTAAKLKAMGELAGVADLVFVWCYNGHLENLYLELKAPGRKMSPEQQVFCQRIRDAGAWYDVADNIDEALGILRKYGILK